MRAGGHRSWWAGAFVAALGALAAGLVLAAPGLASEPISCAYVEAGPPGPAGNVLRVEDGTDSVTHIFRQGDEIVVFNNAASDPTPCSGATPTVFNLDQIEYTATATSVPFFDYIGKGPLAPGATPEASGSEIEISVHEDYQPEVLNVSGTSSADSISIGQLGAHRVGVNLNAQEDGAAADADVVLDTVDPAESLVRVAGRAGDDRISALGGPGFSGAFPGDRPGLSGGPGNDILVGGPRDDRLRGDDGDDVLLGGGGRDRIQIGPGRDLAKGGRGFDRIENVSNVGGIAEDTGPDRVFGGAGNDRIDVAQATPALPGDFVDCGAGHDHVGIDPGDRSKRCEQVEVVRARLP